SSRGEQPPTGRRPPAARGRVTRLPPDPKPTRQLRRAAVKIGRRVLPYERILWRLGPLRVVRTATGRLALRWVRRRG
ncbi:MAG: hypothetical protein LOD91_10470, partial [Limnochordales bacterium]